MKDFLSEYGFAILAAIVVILLIAMCTPVGNLIKNQVMGVVDGFATKTESKLYSLDADNTLGVVITQLDDAGKFSIVATTDSETDVLKASYRVKDQNGNWSPWTDLGNLGSGKEHSGEFQAKIENGNRIQVRVTDEGKADNLFYESNIIEYTGASSAGGEFTPAAGGGSTPTVAMPAKGDLISIEGSQYRVLSMNGTQAKVLAMSDATSMKFNDSSITTSFGGTNGQKYEGSKLDNYLENTWFAGLSQDMKDAIIPQDIVQNGYSYSDEPNTSGDFSGGITYKYQYNWDNSDYENLIFKGSVSIGSRHVFELDIKDIYDYFGKNEITSSELNMMFFNTETSVNSIVWLRSANADDAGSTFYVFGDIGYFDYYNYADTDSVRPAFVIDLSKIDFE